MSVSRGFAQPITRTFIVTQNNAQSSETGAYYFTQANIDSWYADNSSDVNKVSESLYIVSGNFTNIMNNIGNTETQPQFTVRRSLTDLGKEIVFGTPSNSRLIVFRKVQQSVNPDAGGDGVVGYVVVESNYRSLNWPTPEDSLFNVNVARV